MLTRLEEKTDPRNSVLLVIDMQNDFASPLGAFAKKGYNVSMIEEMTPSLVKLIEEAHKIGTLVIFIKSSYSSAKNWYLSEVWMEQKIRRQAGLYADAPVLEEGSWGWELVSPLKPSSTDVVVKKHRYSAFYNTDLDLILRSKNIKSVIMTGATTNICVESTARDAFFRDYYVVFVRDCTASYEPHLHASSLENIEKYFGVVEVQIVLSTVGMPKRVWNTKQRQCTKCTSESSLQTTAHY